MGMQMVTDLLRLVCMNGLVGGEIVTDVHARHRGEIVENVIDGAFKVLDGLKLVREVRDDMRAITLVPVEVAAFDRAALALKYQPYATKRAPITEPQLLAPRRMADMASDMRSTFNRVQENIVQGGHCSSTRYSHHPNAQKRQALGPRAGRELEQEMRS